MALNQFRLTYTTKGKILNITMNNKKPYIIGCGCIARTGKDTFMDMLKKELERMRFSCMKYSLANPLKDEVNSFLINYFNISAYTQDDKEKDIIRDILVVVGKAHRRQSKGRYFTYIADSFIKQQQTVPDFVLIPDIRYAESEYSGTDEVDWLIENNGYFVLLDRLLDDGSYVVPINSDEKRNSERIKVVYEDYYHYHVWKTFSNPQNIEEGNVLVRNVAADILRYFRVV